MEILENGIQYTTRKRINLDTEIVTNDVIKVSSYDTCTSFVNFNRVTKKDIKALLQLHSEIVKLAKAKRIKLSYKNKLKLRLAEIKKSGTYEVAYELYTQRFDQLVELWKGKLEEGLYSGLRDDVVLNNQIYPMQHSITRMFYGNQVLSTVSEIEGRLKDVWVELTAQDSTEHIVSIGL